MAQTPEEKSFTDYASNQSNLLHKEYVKRDTKAYRQLLSELVYKYNKLNDNDQAMFRQYIANSYYNLCCIYTLLNDKKNALDYLDSAVNRGYTNYSHLPQDDDLNNIRTEERYKKVSDYLRSQYDYMYILKRAGTYNDNDQRKIPAFTYESSTDSNLVALRINFKLDSIAGLGNDVSKAINILHWVHNTVHHDGQHESGIEKINAPEIVRTAKAKNIGVSCGELATTLNECYLAMGWKSRKVYCFPKDSLHADYDSHVINIVYMPSKKKWIWMDPTNDAYVMDENGELLSIEEVRYLIINNKKLIVNPDANWNHKSTTTKDYYLGYYMAKNLYRVYCPLKSEFDYETRSNNKEIVYVNLLPLDYFKQKPDKTENVNKKINLSIVRYNINSPTLFWQAPTGK